MLNDAELVAVFDRAAGEPATPPDAHRAFARAQTLRRRRQLLAASLSLALVAGAAGTTIALTTSSTDRPAVITPAEPDRPNPTTTSPQQVATPFTIPDGYTLSQSLPIIAEATGLKLIDLQAASSNATALGLPTWATGVQSAEGFLFPGTYAPSRGTAAPEVLRAMVARFNQKAVDLGLESKASALGVTPLQAVTLASIVEREAPRAADSGRIARVIFNRLANPGLFPTLGMDSTTRYATGILTGPLGLPELENPSPYNTRVSPGIPPGPIGSPGEASLDAILNPPRGDWTYFIYLPAEKQTLFTGSAYEFQALESRYCQQTGGC